MRFGRVACALGGAGRVRLIGESAPAVLAIIQGAAVAELRIAEAVAADAGGGILALFHRVEAAAGHVPGHISAAIVAGGRAGRSERAKSSSDNERRSRHAKFPNCSHLLRLISCCWM